MINGIKQIKQELDLKIKNRVIEKDSDGKVVLQMHCKSLSDLYSSLSSSNYYRLSSDCQDFIFSEAKNFPCKTQFKLNVTLENENLKDRDIDKEREKLKKAVEETFVNEYVENKISLKRNLYFSLIIFSIGVILIVIKLLMDHFLNSPVYLAIMEIFSWVFIWEATDLFCLERSGLRIKSYRYLCLTQMTINIKTLKE